MRQTPPLTFGPFPGAMQTAFFLLSLVALVFWGESARADSQPLAKCRSALVPLRPPQAQGHEDLSLPFHHAAPDTKLRNATPVLTTVKHCLRDWVEARLTGMGENGDEEVLTVQLNDDLRRADLLCQGAARDGPDRCLSKHDQWNGIGFLDPIQISRRQFGTVIVVRTGVGILCGSDQSAYAYEWRDNAWRRFWQSEQEIHPGEPYRPQYIDSVAVSRPPEKLHSRLVLSLGNEWWCASNWYDVYFRLWRTSANGEDSKPLIDEAQFAYLAWRDPPINGSIGEDDALIEFRAPSLDRAVHSYETVRHYKVDAGRVDRIDPIALSPRSFVEEWLLADWTESVGWTPNHRASLEAWHREYHGDQISGEYIEASQHCRRVPDLWQVGIEFGRRDTPKSDAYFLVRWRPPYHFEMVDVRATPRADCNDPDYAADGEHTLFPIQDPQ